MTNKGTMLVVAMANKEKDDRVKNNGIEPSSPAGRLEEGLHAVSLREETCHVCTRPYQWSQ